jgi:hypothetical protein
MTKSEKELIEQLNGITNKTGKISIDIETNYFFGFSNLGVMQYIGQSFAAAQSASKYYFNNYFFGYSDILSNYQYTKQNSLFFISESVGTYAPHTFETRNFLIFTDNRQITIPYFYNQFGFTFVNVPVFALQDSIQFHQTKFRNGDIIIFELIADSTNAATYFLWRESLIHCDNLPYTQLCELLQSENINIKSLTIDYGNILTALPSNKSIPDQLTLPLTIIKANIFGQKTINSINPDSFATADNYNNRKIFIPLNINSKGLSLALPFAFNTGKTNISFSIQLN